VEGHDEKQQEELRASMADLNNTATGEFKKRLDNVSNTWLLTTVAKLDHQSRDVVSGLSASAEEKLRSACAEVFPMLESRCASGCKKLPRSFRRRLRANRSKRLSSLRQAILTPRSLALLRTTRRQMGPFAGPCLMSPFRSEQSCMCVSFMARIAARTAKSGCATGALYNSLSMANRAYLRIWTREFSRESMVAQFVRFLATVPLSAQRNGFDNLVIQAIDRRRRLFPNGISARALLARRK